MRLQFLLALMLGATTAQAGVSDMIASEGLAKTEAALLAQTPSDASQKMALGAVRFLRGIEKTLQLRWQYDAQIYDLDIPILRLPVARNPQPKPFDPAMISALFSELEKDMAASRDALEGIGENDDAVMELNLRDIWFDVNMNGTRDDDEELMIIGANTFLPSRGFNDDTGMPISLSVRFDRADVDWLIAYTELLSGASEIVAAFDPTQAIKTVQDADQKMADLLGTTIPDSGMDMQFGGWVDQFSMLYGAISVKPDPAHTKAARDHWLKMIAANRSFWKRVARETDNDREWIPNDQQNSALGMELPAGTGASWLGVLDDMEKVLNGELLVPFWRITPAGGVNVRHLLEEPPKVDIVGWVQGWGLVDYMQRGPQVSAESLRRFDALMTGRASLMAIYLN